MSRQGRVILVGAGPGDPGLLTMAAADSLKEADVIIYDRLVDKAVLDLAGKDAELIFAGKESGGESSEQEEINGLLVARAGEGKLVVRLKGGDPFVFGRGGEEALALRRAGIPYDIVPGVTSAIAVPAYAGIPVTHRGVSSSFAVITGHEDTGKPESAIRWDALAQGPDTLVVLMGTRALPKVVENLLAGGKAAETPVAVIHWGTKAVQRTITGSLGDIVDRVTDAGLEPPTVAVIGDVVRLRDDLAWFEDRPLLGKRILVTRSRSRAGTLARMLTREGALPVELPSIEIEPIYEPPAVDEAVAQLKAGAYAWVVFTSASAVSLFFSLLRERGLDARSFAGVEVACIGPATAEELARHGIVADSVPEAEYQAEGVLEALRPHLTLGQRALLPRAEGARPELVQGLEGIGVKVDELILYRAAIPSAPSREALSRLRRGEIDIVTFTSSSTVRNLARLLNDDVEPLKRCLIACIGPITAEAARGIGLNVDIMAKEYTVNGLVAALIERLKKD